MHGLARIISTTPEVILDMIIPRKYSLGMDKDCRLQLRTCSLLTC